MPRRAFLHVGSPKTGTTYLQAILWANRERLADDGVLLPGRSIHDHFQATWDLRERPERAGDPERVTGAWDRLVEEARDWAGDVVVSHEMLASATAEQAASGIRRFADLGCEVHVVLTARDMGRQLPAEWQERVKHRSGLDFATYMEQADDPENGMYHRLWAAQDYVGIAERWGATLPAERFHVVTVPAPGAAKDVLWRRFAEVLGLDPDRYDLEVPRENSSIRLEQALLLRRVNRELGDRLPLPGRYTGVVKELFAHQVLEGRPGTKIVLGGDDLAFARARSQAMVDGLRARGVVVVGSLDDLLVPEDGGAAESSGRGEVPAETLLEESVAATAELLDRVGARTEAWEEQRRGLRQELRRVRQRAQESRAENERLRRVLEEERGRRLRARAGRVKRRLVGVVRRPS